MNYTRSLGGSALLAAALFLTCKSDERPDTLQEDIDVPAPPPGVGGSGGRPNEVSDAGPASGPDAVNRSYATCSWKRWVKTFVTSATCS